MFFQNIVCQKNYKIGVSAHFLIMKVRTIILIVVDWSKLAFFGTPNLDQLIALTWTN